MQTNVQQQNEQVYLISNYSASPATAAISVVVDHGRATAGQAPSIIGGFVKRGPADPFLNERYVHVLYFNLLQQTVSAADH